jgi:hypothetical protein
MICSVQSVLWFSYVGNYIVYRYLHLILDIHAHRVDFRGRDGVKQCYCNFKTQFPKILGLGVPIFRSGCGAWVSGGRVIQHPTKIICTNIYDM